MSTPDSIDIEDLISRVARRHKILLSEDDPVLVTVTLNEYILEHYSEITKKSTEKLKIDLEEIYYRQAEESKECARRVMNVTLKSARDIITESAKQASLELTEKINNQQELFIARCNKIAEEQRKGKITTIIFSCAAIAAATISMTVFLIQ